MELMAGDIVTVGVVLEGVPPPPPVPVFPLLLADDEPQPIAAKPMAAASMQAATICLRFRVEPGIKKITSASTAVPPAVLNHFELPKDSG
jgi:hypothetical protein